MMIPKLTKLGLIGTAWFLLGVVVGGVWVRWNEPKIGNFHVPEGVVPYVAESHGPQAQEIQSRDNQLATKGRGDKRERSDGVHTVPAFVSRLYETIGDDGRLTWGIRDLAGLDDKTALAVQASIDEAFNEFERLAKENLHVLEDQKLSRGSSPTYELKAFSKQGDEIWEKLEREFVDLAGKHSASFLIAAFHPERQFGYLGKYNYRISFVEADGGYHDAMFREEFIDPVSGNSISSGGRRPRNMPKWIRIVWAQTEKGELDE